MLQQRASWAEDRAQYAMEQDPLDTPPPVDSSLTVAEDAAAEDAAAELIQSKFRGQKARDEVAALRAERGLPELARDRSHREVSHGYHAKTHVKLQSKVSPIVGGHDALSLSGKPPTRSTFQSMAWPYIRTHAHKHTHTFTHLHTHTTSQPLPTPYPLPMSFTTPSLSTKQHTQSAHTTPRHMYPIPHWQQRPFVPLFLACSSFPFSLLSLAHSASHTRPPAPSDALLAHSPLHQIVAEGKKRITAEVSATEAMDRINKLEHSLRNANILRKKAETDAQHLRERLGEDAPEDAAGTSDTSDGRRSSRTGRRSSVQTAVRIGKVKNENVIDTMAAQAKEQVRRWKC